jgi:hypothetical protein
MNDKTKKRIVALSLPVALFLFAVSAGTPWIGWCPESNFMLSPDSRFPKWFALPPGYDRKDLTVEIAYYAPPPFIKSNFKTVLLGPAPGYRQLDKKIGIVRLHPITEKQLNAGVDHYPSFHVVQVNGTDELIEHKKMEPIFYISDDPEMIRTMK